VGLAAAAVVAGRLPFAGTWLGKDEAGFLEIGRQWHSRGTSLYSNYWVDRPPLLITIFQAAAWLGGTIPLRLIGIGAAVITVLAVAHAAQTLAGPRAATGAAITAAALLISPRAGAVEVDGELLAAPFIAIGIAAAITMLTAASTRRALTAAALTGACGILAVLVKQNMLDVLVFAGALVLLRIRTLSPARAAIVTGGALAGALLTTLTTALWTAAHATSLSGVWFAMYRFRIEAAAVIDTDHRAGVALRGRSLLMDIVVSGMVLVIALIVPGVVRARRDNPSDSPAAMVARAVPLALVVTLSYAAVSIYLGKSYWGHYLVQLAVPLALVAGLAATHRPRTGRLVIAALVVSSAAATLSLGLHPPGPGGNRLGSEIAAVAQPGDTIVTIWGHPNVTRASALPSPYPHLFSLPARTLDPHARLLDATMTGPHPPTWFVRWSGIGLHGVDAATLTTVLRRNYHRVARLHGHVIYLHDGLSRSTPTALSEP
jgi:hypothetical protein